MRKQYSTASARQKLFVMVITLMLLPALAFSTETKKFSFQHGEHNLAGTLMLPDHNGPHPVVLFVHGDGPIERESYGVYRPIWEAFLNAGYGIYSWDKAGVGESTGDWQSQSMSDRADELIAAGKALKANDDINHLAVWGISQAGWAIPIAVERSNTTQSRLFESVIIVSGAINWMDQSRYLTEQRMRYEGASALEIKQALAWEKRHDPLLNPLSSYADYKENTLAAQPCCPQVMTEERWIFAKKNIAADVTPYLEKIDVPVLAIFGEFDANVDIKQSKKVYRQKIPSSLLTIKTFPNANHAIMPANAMRPMGMNSLLKDIYLLLKIEFLGAKAYAPDYINTMTEWLDQKDKIHHHN